jgi:hypothetical protein
MIVRSRRALMIRAVHTIPSHGESSMSKLSSADIESRMRAASEQVTQEFEKIVDAKVLAECVASAQGLVAGSRIPDFAPIFFGRHARRLLRQAAADVPPPAAPA